MNIRVTARRRTIPLAPKSKSGAELSASALKLRLLKGLRCTLKYEKVAWASGANRVAGVDEVGRGSLFGPVIGAVIFLLLQEGLSRVTEYPDLILGPILLLVAIYVHGGIGGLMEGRRRG